MSYNEKCYTPLKGTVIATTDNAILLEDEDGQEKWIPRSVIEDGDAVEKDDCNPEVAEWFCEKEGLS